jgi:hypothetical protein
MLLLVIVQPIETGSFANGYRSISSRVRQVIVIERHGVVESLIMLGPSFPSLLDDFLIKVVVFA